MQKITSEHVSGKAQGRVLLPSWAGWHTNR